MWGSGLRSPAKQGSRTLEVKPSYKRWAVPDEVPAAARDSEEPAKVAADPGAANTAADATSSQKVGVLSKKVRKALLQAQTEQLPTAADSSKERTIKGKTGDLKPILFEKAAEWIFEADALFIGTGAGMGVASGLATYRGRHAAQWDQLPGINVDYEEACTPKWFERDLNLAWTFWGQCAEAYRTNAPNVGYTLCRKLAAACPNGGFVFTSNVDGHWLASGFASDRVYEKHGSVHFWQCTDPLSCRSDVWPASHCTARFPVCPKCKRPARPNVLMFHDSAWSKEGRCQAQADRYHAFVSRIQAAVTSSRKFVVCLEIGAGTEVPTVRMEMERIAKQLGDSKLIRINLDQAEIPAGLCEAQRAVGLGVSAVEGLHRIHEHLNLLRSGEAKVVHTLARGAEAVANAVLDVVHENRLARETGHGHRLRAEDRKPDRKLSARSSDEPGTSSAAKKDKPRKSKSSLRKNAAEKIAGTV